MEITKQEAENFLKELRASELKEAEKALQEWTEKYKVTIDVEFSYSPLQGLQKKFILLDIK